MPHLTRSDRANIAWIVGCLHVGASNRAVITFLARRMAKTYATRMKILRGLRREAYRVALRVHAQNRKLLMTGR